MDKVVASPEEAIADLSDGASVAVTGFGTSYGFPCSLLVATRDKGVKNLCLVCNSPGAVGQLRSVLLIQSGQVSRMVVSFSSRPGLRTRADEMIEAGEMEVELVAQGILVERMRAGGAGIPAFYTSVGVGTPIAEGKEVRYFDGKPHILEHALRVDFALLRGHRADRLGNVQFRGTNANFNPAFAKGARTAIVEVEEIVEPGEIPPDQIHLPGAFVDRVVKATIQPDAVRPAPRRPADKPRLYNGKPSWTRNEMARRIAEMLPEHSYVNLGTGMPTLVSNYLGDRDIILQGENGILGYGEMVEGEAVDPAVFNAAGQFVAAQPGVAFFDSVTAFEMARGGRLDVVVLGAYQVDQEGNLANYSTGNPIQGGIGGAMDLVAGKKTLIVMMEHRDSKDRAKLVRRATIPLTGVACVDVVVTDIAILHRRDGVFVVEEVAEGFSPKEVIELADMEMRIGPKLA